MQENDSSISKHKHAVQTNIVKPKYTLYSSTKTTTNLFMVILEIINQATSNIFYNHYYERTVSTRATLKTVDAQANPAPTWAFLKFPRNK